jgi:tetratricopeptide (TPR) repeat protein
MITSKKANLLDVVEMLEELPEYGISKGERGTVVEVFEQPEAYMLEFVDISGKTSRIADSVKPDQILSTQETARRAMENGIKLHNEGKGGQAREEFELAAALDPTLINELHDRTVRSFESQGDFEKPGTFERFSLAMRLILSLKPGHRVARKNLAIAFEHQGILQANQGNLIAAIRNFRIALAVDNSVESNSSDVASHIRSNLATAWIQLGLTAFQDRKYEELLHLFGLAFEVDPNERTRTALAMAHAWLALSRLDQDDVKAAWEHLQLAYDISGVLAARHESLTYEVHELSESILNFINQGSAEFSIDLQSKRIEARVPQLDRQRYETAA